MKDINKIISQTSEETAAAVISELKNQGMLKDNKQTPFQKTETLLYNYFNFKAAVENKYKQIETIQEEGVPKKSSSITSFVSNATYDVKTEFEKAEDMIKTIENSIHVTVKFIKIIDAALEFLKSDPYYDIIALKYFEGKTREEIADRFQVDVKTISRNKNRLVNMLQIRLFSDECIIQLFS